MTVISKPLIRSGRRRLKGTKLLKDLDKQQEVLNIIFHVYKINAFNYWLFYC